jgi:histidinol-phosphate aminotransferase
MNRLIPFRTLRPATASLALAALLVASPLAFAGKPTIDDGNVRISSNENAWGFSPKALERMREVLDSGNYYNGNEVAEMIRLCAEKEGVPAEYILPTPGSGPVLLMTAWAYAKPDANAVTTEKGYGQLTSEFADHGGQVISVQLGANMGYDFKALALAINEKTAVVYICNPNNPTGVIADPAELRRFIMSVPQNVLVFVDEAYLELSDTGLAANTMAPLVKVRKNLIISRTFSKAYGMAGLRAGYGIAHPDVLKKLRKYYAGGPSFLAAIAAQEAIKDQAHLESNRKNYQEVRNYVTREFDRLGITYAKPQGAFIYFNAGKKRNEIVMKLRDAKIVIGGVRGGVESPDGGGDWTRVSLGTREEMDLFLGELTKILGKS